MNSSSNNPPGLLMAAATLTIVGLIVMAFAAYTLWQLWRTRRAVAQQMARVEYTQRIQDTPQDHSQSDILCGDFDCGEGWGES